MGPDCRVHGYLMDTLEFTLLDSAGVASQTGDYPNTQGTCSGILHMDQHGIHFGGGDGEGEGICVVSKFEENKVLAVCSALL